MRITPNATPSEPSQTRPSEYGTARSEPSEAPQTGSLPPIALRKARSGENRRLA